MIKILPLIAMHNDCLTYAFTYLIITSKSRIKVIKPQIFANQKSKLTTKEVNINS